MTLQVKPRKSWPKVLLIVLGVLVALSLVVGGIYWWINRDSSQPVSPEPEPITVVSADINALFMGNVFWGRYTNDWSMASGLKYEFPFSRLGEFGREEYTAWIAGLECPTVKGDKQTSAQQEATLSFNCPPEYLPEAKKWFTAFTLANNHTDNRGKEGFSETKEHLDENGIQYFGHYDPTLKDEACDVISIPADITYSDGETKRQYLPVAMCGFHGVFQIPPQATIESMQKYSQYMPVIAFPHMGAEYVAEPDDIKTRTYRSMIDNGADFVLGDHPHWIQTTESYKGKLIVYSMGNFMFDQQGIPERVRSAAIKVKMHAENDDSLSKWLEFSEDCKKFKDDCLERAVEQNLSKIGYTYKFGVIGSNNDKRLVKPATQVEMNAILTRLKWNSTINQLQSPYGGM